VMSPLSLVGLLAAAAPDAPVSAQFAAEAVRICVETRADPAAVRQLAEAEGWMVADPATAPGKSSIVLGAKKKKDDRTFTRNRAWTLQKGGSTFTVGLFDFPDEPRVRQCQLAGWDLDFAAVDSALRADGRFRADSSIPNLPFRMYSVSGVRASVTYIQSDTGTKQLHALTVSPAS
jgi:hypothetical protein